MISFADSVGGTRFFANRPASNPETPPEPPIPEVYHRIAKAIPFYPLFTTAEKLASMLNVPAATIKCAMTSLRVGRQYLIIAEDKRGYSRLNEDLSNVR